MMSTERIKAFAMLAAQILTIVNMALSLTGKNPLPFSEDDAYTAVSAVLTAVANIWAWWRPNRVTTKAILKAEGE